MAGRVDVALAVPRLLHQLRGGIPDVQRYLHTYQFDSRPMRLRALYQIGKSQYKNVTYKCTSRILDLVWVWYIRYTDCTRDILSIRDLRLIDQFRSARSPIDRRICFRSGTAQHSQGGVGSRRLARVSGDLRAKV